jgi:hypothetical protein
MHDSLSHSFLLNPGRPSARLAPTLYGRYLPLSFSFVAIDGQPTIVGQHHPVARTDRSPVLPVQLDSASGDLQFEPVIGQRVAFLLGVELASLDRSTLSTAKGSSRSRPFMCSVRLLPGFVVPF